ncbi:MAG: MATE family efflux transporter [Thermoguttaceae bacterium]|nr:MATE family efflux transporter [Thermoguttaceae bacterium]
MADRSGPEYMGEAPVGTILLEFSTPTIIASVIAATYNFVARIFVGQSIGSVGIAALGIAFPIMLIQLAFAMMVGTGASTLIAIELGKKRFDQAEKILGQAIFLYAVFSALFILLGLPLIEPLLRLFGATEEILPYAKEYLTIIIWGMFFSNMTFGVNNFIRSEGKPRFAMITIVFSGLLNVVFAWMFLFVFKTGIWGAALANVLALVITSVWVSWLYLSGRTVLRWRLRYFWFHPALAWDIIVYGMVPLATQSCSSLVQAVQNNVLRAYGASYGVKIGLGAAQGSVLAISTMATIFPITMLVLMPILGLSQGMQPIVGYNVGARKHDRVLRTLKLSLCWSFSMCVLFVVVMLFFPHLFLRPFVRATDVSFAPIMALGAHALRYMMLSFPAVGINVITSAYFQSHGRPILSFMLTIFRQLVFLLPVIFGLPLLLSRLGIFEPLDGVWLAYVISDGMALVVSTVLIVREFRIKNRVIASVQG